MVRRRLCRRWLLGLCSRSSLPVPCTSHLAHPGLFLLLPKLNPLHSRPLLLSSLLPACQASLPLPALTPRWGGLPCTTPTCQRHIPPVALITLLNICAPTGHTSQEDRDGAKTRMHHEGGTKTAHRIPATLTDSCHGPGSGSTPFKVRGPASYLLWCGRGGPTYGLPQATGVASSSSQWLLSWVTTTANTTTATKPPNHHHQDFYHHHVRNKD